MTTQHTPRRARSGDARDRAAEVLVRVEVDRAYATAALDAALDREPALAPSDRALCTELVYGTLRAGRALEGRLVRHADRPESIAALDPYTRAVLRVAAYQLLVLERVPPHAAVDHAVGALKQDRSKGLAGFANALLRKVGTERAEGAGERARVELGLESVPRSVRRRIAECVGGAGDAERVLRAMMERAPATHVRVERTRGTVESVRELLRDERPGAVVTAGRVSPWALRVEGAGDLRSTSAYEAGAFAVQEEGAQCIALAVGVEPGMRVLDACAGRGGKSAALASMMDGRGVLRGLDLYPEKLARGEDEQRRLGLVRETLDYRVCAVDLERGVGSVAESVEGGVFDRVLVDAPCSGLGTLARRPDLLTRLGERALDVEVGEEESAEGEGIGRAKGEEREGGGERERTPLAQVQRAALARCAGLVSVGGELLYAVCTLTREEGPGMAEWFFVEHPGFERAEGGSGMPERVRASEGVLRPDRDGTDGFVWFRARRVR